MSWNISLRCILNKWLPFKLDVSSREETEGEETTSVYFDYVGNDWSVEELGHDIKIDRNGRVYFWKDDAWVLQELIIGVQFRRGD